MVQGGRASTTSLAVLALVLLAAPLSAPAGEGAPGPLERNVEWFGMNLGGGALMFNLGATDSEDVSFARFVPQADLLLFNLSLPGWYLTLLELHPAYFLGAVGGGLRAGGRIALSADQRQELRLGAYVGCDALMYHINAFHPALALQPHLQYVYLTDLGSVGVGLDVLLLFHFRAEMMGGDGHTFDVPPVAYGATVYLRWTVGRLAW